MTLEQIRAQSAPAPEAPAPKGFFGRVADVAREEVRRGGERLESTAAQLQGAKNPLEAAAAVGVAPLRAGGAVARTIFSPITVGLGTLIDKVSNIPAVQKFAMSKPVAPVLEATKRVGAKVGEVAAMNPELASDVQDFVDVATSIVGPKAVTTGASAAAGATKTAFRVPARAVAGVPARALAGQQRKAVDALEQKYYEWMGQTKPGVKRINKVEAATAAKNRAGTEGEAPPRILAEARITPRTDPGNPTKFSTIAQADELRASLRPMHEANKKNMQELLHQTEPAKITDLERAAVAKASERSMPAGDKKALVDNIRDEYALLREKYGESIYITALDEEKRAYWGGTKFDSTKPFKNQAHYNIASSMQKKIEDMAAKAGSEDVAQFNRFIGDQMEAAKFLESLDGNTIKYGRLGRLTGMVIGSTLGTSLPGKILGAIGGDLVARALISTSVSNPVKRMILKSIKDTTTPEVYQSVLNWVARQETERATRLALPPGERPMITPPPRDTSGTVPAVPGQNVPVNQPVPPSRMLGPAPTITPPPRDVSGVSVVPAARTFGRSPESGRYFRAYTGEAAGRKDTGSFRYSERPAQPAAISDPLYEYNNFKGAFADEFKGRTEFMDAINEHVGGIENAKRGVMPIDKLEATEHFNASNNGVRRAIEEIKSGTRVPLVIDGSGAVMDGNHRLAAYKALGIREVPVVGPKPPSRGMGINSQEMIDSERKGGDGANPALFGAAAGVEVDEEGKMRINPAFAALGVLGGGLAMKASTLTTRTLNRLRTGAKGSTVSRQFIEDLTNRPDLKQGERELIRAALKEEGPKVDVKSFTAKVQAQLLPLKATSPGYQIEPGIMAAGGRYENIVLPDELRGPVASYHERIYESPIETSAGGVHFSSSQRRGGDPKGYFAHTRIEDLAEKGATKYEKTGQSYNMATGAVIEHTSRVPRPSEAGKTRRVIELQSDLFQKGNLEVSVTLEGQPEKLRAARALRNLIPVGQETNPSARVFELIRTAKPGLIRTLGVTNLDEFKAAVAAGEQAIVGSKEYAALAPYRNTWWQRIVREEVAQAAKDGKTRLQFPVGETAMKIEGLGEIGRWTTPGPRGADFVWVDATADNLKVGQQINPWHQGGPQGGLGDEWIITDVLGDGKFKAVPKTSYDSYDKIPTTKEKQMEYMERDKETFDISGKIDTSNPIHQFYQKDVSRYLANNYGAKEVTDPQGVKWMELEVPKEAAKLPVEAFGAGAVLTSQDQEERGGILGAVGALADRIGGVTRYKRPAEPAAAAKPATVRGVTFSKGELSKLRNVLFAEISNRTSDKQKLEARTIINTIINRARSGDVNSFGKTVDEILSKPRQYQGYGSREYERIASGGVRETDARKLAAIDEILGQLEAGDLEDNIGGYTFYHHNPDGSITATQSTGGGRRRSARS